MFRSITDGVKHLLIINVIMFGVTMLISPEMMYSSFGLFFPVNNMFQPWQIVSHMFMHGGLSHLLFNMFALYMFGTAVERIYVTNSFLFLYFSCGLGAAIISLIFSYYNFYSVLDVLVSSDISKSEILDHERMNRPGQKFYKILAESALRAVRICQPLRVPQTGYKKWKNIQLNFNPTEMLRG